MSHHVTTAREETARQIERCVVLDKQIARRRIELRRECEHQRSALRRVAWRVERAEHARRRPA
jgi:hypothetical protein